MKLLVMHFHRQRILSKMLVDPEEFRERHATLGIAGGLRLCHNLSETWSVCFLRRTGGRHVVFGPVGKTG
jgi:hypothetical protein